jgi:carbon monoxide dehydrogenase subunit G
VKLENRFTVPVPRTDAWKVLIDVERVAPCMPGATLTSRDGDEFTGTVKVKVGPINLTYGGKATFVSLDEAAGIAVIEGSGKETRGTGTAKALITCRLIDQGSSTDVEVETDLTVTGKPAQFGRGVLADVSAKLVDKFAACLSEELAAGDSDEPPASSATEEPAGSVPAATAAVPAATPSATPAAATTSAAAPAAAITAPAAPVAPRRPVREAVPIDLLDAAGLPVLKRVAPVLVVLLVVLWLLRRLRS